jgi:putative membrane-bound dehydrogenase-like protein
MALGRKSIEWRLLTAALLVAASAAPAAGGEAYSGLPPAEEIKTFRLPAAFRIELVASEPDVEDPVAMTWDSHGRMWVAELSDYPLESTGGRVRCLSDQEPTGRFRRSAVFAEGLPFPSSVLAYRAGLLLTAAPDILYLEDSDGDGRADVRRVALTGFAAGNTQLRANGLLYGPDLRIYGANGRSGGKPRRPSDPQDRAVDIGERDFRFDPDTFEPEATSGPSQFGHGFDDWGRRFLSWNTVHIREDMLPPRDLERHPRLRRTSTVASISDHGDSARVYPRTPPPRTFNNEPTDHFNASCGLTIERGGLFPAEYAGNSYLCEPLTNLVHRDRLEPGPGPALIARRGENEDEFLTSTDPWFHPVNLKSGPDGGLYLADFYRELVEHPDYVPRELRGGVDFRRGKGHGRIWRILPRQKGPLPLEELSGLGPPELVERLRSPNGPVRETAQRLLAERREPGTADLLAKLARSNREPLARALALWTLLRFQALPAEGLALALDDPEPRLRETAIRIAREEPRSAAVLSARLVRLLADSDPGVRFQAVLAAGDLREGGLEAELPRALATAASRDGGDRWMRLALASSLRDREPLFLEELYREEPPRVLEETGWIREVAALAGEEGEGPAASSILSLAASRIEKGRPASGFRLADGVALGLSRAGRSPRDLLRDAPEGETARRWGRFFARAAEVATAPAASPEPLLAAASLLSHAPFRGAGEVLKGLLDPRNETEIQVAAARALGGQEEAAAVDLLLASWPASTPRVRAAIVESLLARPARARALARALEVGRIRPAEIGLPERSALLSSLDAEGKKRLEMVLRPAETDRSAVIARYREKGTQTGDRFRGAEVFKKSCASCHRFAELGHAVGPDLAGIGKKSREELLVALFDPNRAVVPGYSGYTVVTAGGQVVTGILASETARAITLRRAEGLEDDIPRSSIRSISSTGASLMPEGLEAALSPEAVADLLEFLRRGESR